MTIPKEGHMNLTDDPLATIDAKGLEADIDKAIDELFVQKSPAATPPAPEEKKPAKTEAKQKQAEEPVAKAEPDLLGGLKESLLSLDWEISTDNIRKFETEVKALSEKLADDRHTAAVVKMTLGICKYLKVMKSSASATSMQFLHAAVRTLDLLQRKQKPGTAELKEVMDKLLVKFRRLKADVQRVKPAATPARPPEPEPSLAVPLVEEPEPVVPPAEEEAAPEPPPEPIEAAPEPVAAMPKEEEELEPLFEPEEPVAEPAAAVPEAEVELELPEEEMGQPWQRFIHDASEQSRQLSSTLAKLSQDTSEFFDRLLQSIAGKPALDKVSGYFTKAQSSLEERIGHAHNLARLLAAVVENLQQSSPPAGLATSGQAGPSVLDAQLQQLQKMVARLNQVVTRLERGSAGPTPDQAPLAEDKEAPAEKKTVKMKSGGGREGTVQVETPEDFIELHEEITPEPPRPVPASLATIYLANVARNTLGISTDAVASVFKVSKGKAKLLRKRGYATLMDFKAPFMSIKRGLAGPLTQLQVKELKNVRFPIINLSPEVLGAQEAASQPPIKGIVLLSTAEHHGALFTDDVMEKRPYDAFGYSAAGLVGEVSGTVTIEGDFEINVLNMDRLLS
jgi:hypothetical protein